MTLPFAILGALTVAGALTVLTLRNLVHCVLGVALAFIGLAGLYLQLGAQFVGFAQVLVYVGAVAILIVFAIFLTTTNREEQISRLAISSSWIAGGVVAAAVLGVLAWAIHSSVTTKHSLPPQSEISVRQIGDALMLGFAIPLEVVGLLLTAALIGAVTIAAREKRGVK